MRRISPTIARFDAAALRPKRAGPGRLQPLGDFVPNPGALQGWSYVPSASTAMPLVVVLHGCTQSAAGYDLGSGWSDLAERFGFAVLFPEQNRANNPNGCFNWFLPDDTRRDGGEAASIRQMIGAMLERHPIDPARIFITGLSAGGAMTSVLLAAYPDVFAGGAIIAGLPYGAATSVAQALERMRGRGYSTDRAYASAIRAASPHNGPWPSVSVWHGSADATVADSNSDRIVGQWRTLQGLPAVADREETVAGNRHRLWHGPGAAVQLEEYRIAGMGHGTPLATSGETACGKPMPYMLDAGISSTWHIAQRWGLLGQERVVVASEQEARPAPGPPPSSPINDPFDVQGTIEAALRSAGLMR